MYKFAIVEDEKSSSDKLVAYIEKFGKEIDASFEVEVYDSPLDFISGYKCDCNLIFMDIEMPEMDGMTLSYKIREVDKQVLIIFVTNMAQYAVRGYDVGAFSFIVKPVTYSNFSLKMNMAMEKMCYLENDWIQINTKTSSRKLYIKDIKYIEVINHSLIWHTVTEKIECSGTLTPLKEKLGPSFAFCNRCYLVNLRYCSEVMGYKAIVGGEQLQISRPKRSEFISSLNMYLNGRIKEK